MKKLIIIMVLIYCSNALTAQIKYKRITTTTTISEIPEISGSWMLGCTRTTGFTANCKDYTVKFYDAPWSLSATNITSFNNGFLLDNKSAVLIRLANGKLGQKFTMQITASAASSGNLSFSNHKGENLGNVKLSGNNKNSLVSFVYESTGENGKEFLKLTSEEYWNLDKIQIASIKK